MLTDQSSVLPKGWGKKTRILFFSYLESEASTPEQEFSRHFDLDDLEPAVLNQALQDSSAEEEEPVSAASQLIPDLEHVFDKPQSEELVPDQDLVRVTIPEPEPEKYIRLHITEEEERTAGKKDQRLC